MKFTEKKTEKSRTYPYFGKYHGDGHVVLFTGPGTGVCVYTKPGTTIINKWPDENAYEPIHGTLEL